MEIAKGYTKKLESSSRPPGPFIKALTAERGDPMRRQQKVLSPFTENCKQISKTQHKTGTGRYSIGNPTTSVT
jgi:hypothetical protein